MKIKKSLLILFVFSLAFSLAAIFQISKTKAGVGNNTSGWPWGGSDDGNMTGAGVIPTGLGWISLNSTNTGGATDYGVNIPTADGNLSGYAWSSNLGWIDFAPAGPYPASPNNSAMRVGNNLKGWARIIGIRDAGANAGGWSGWIKLGSETGDPIAYGIDITKMKGAAATLADANYAWSKELGWIDFSRATGSGAPPKTLTTSLTAVPGGCIACPSVTSTLTGTRTGGTATGDITYEFDCTNDGTYEYTTTTAAASQAYSCTYLATATARVKMTQEGVFSESTTTIAILAAVCGNGSIEGSEVCDDGAGNGACPATCSASCTTNSCPVNSGNWKEVAP